MPDAYSRIRRLAVSCCKEETRSSSQTKRKRLSEESYILLNGTCCYLFTLTEVIFLPGGVSSKNMAVAIDESTTLSMKNRMHLEIGQWPGGTKAREVEEHGTALSGLGKR